MAIKINKGRRNKQVKKDLRVWSVEYMDDQAKGVGFDDLMDLRIPDDDSPEEEALKQAGNAFRKSIRSAVKGIQKDVEDDLRAMPTEEELRLELPELTLS